MSGWSPLASAVGLVLSGLIMVVFALVGANMLLLLCSAWLLAYAGVFFLGFGGSRWTSDIAINYYKKILEIGASLFTMILLTRRRPKLYRRLLLEDEPRPGRRVCRHGRHACRCHHFAVSGGESASFGLWHRYGGFHRPCRHREFRGRCGYWRGAGLAAGAAGMAGVMVAGAAMSIAGGCECINSGLQVRAREHVRVLEV